ncbi:MAG: hypothetical protein A4E65_00790 [Syntrophorhabdus sp. PtaU1.Bin153]|nr:MAG: hypothetical protein A4E65_00790 [Syntrophorhabdus sp. PtaU1.Bin153]
MLYNDWNLGKLPPEGDKDVGPFFYLLWEIGYGERLRLNLEERWHENHRLYRGNHWNDMNKVFRRNSHKVPINLIFANILRTVANITARNPIAEVVCTDGIQDDAGKILTEKMRIWWGETEQGTSISRSALNMELNGITIEKGYYNAGTKAPDVAVIDPFAYVPCPGYYDDLNDCPYHCHMTIEDCSAIEDQYGLEEGSVDPDDVYTIFGEDREENWIAPAGTRYGTVNYPGNYSSTVHPIDPMHTRHSRAMVIEIWIRDRSTKTVKEPVPQTVIDEATGKEVVQETVIERIVPKYPGGIRVVRLTNRGKLVLEDGQNPNINPALPLEVVSKTYLFDHFPFYKANSYEDPTSIWGFSAPEQLGDIQRKIDEIVSRMNDYIARCLMPPLIVPIDTGITKEMIKQRAGLILQPRTAMAAQGIHYLSVPNLPSNFFDVLEFYLKMFDRIYQIEDADRGEVPNRIISGAAIAALQERNAVLIRHKIRAMDYIVRQRGRCAISLFQNFSVVPENVEVEGTPYTIMGVQYAGREFNYVVESGSTVARTQLQVQEQAVDLYKMGVIDRQAILETLNYPGWKGIIERMGETQLDQALNILVQAGLPIEAAQVLKIQLAQPQGGPGNTEQEIPQERRPGGAMAPVKSEQGRVAA